MTTALQNVAVAATAIDVCTDAIQELAGNDLNGSDMKELEAIFSQELHIVISEKANVQG
ncbi:hypothetical protein [Vibrio phage vB_VmeM-Yong XC32]|nr:hypothetical protein [Vibrio phage vB_VmeM-Yong XC31]QAX96443.1 hypothetical protein [Vibrio phage vB_VmeM-Yong XC32]QAX96760.1 hypothetical protein [Vibrio phage vB_VmeM-Yong MS31]QAX97079.1 hypothetical protein [Vibrio phage vB_VmeM-Yong MS32]